MIAQAVKFIKLVRTGELDMNKFSASEILQFANENGFEFTEEELLEAHRRLFLLFNTKSTNE